jgi:hypothetical protein
MRLVHALLAVTIGTALVAGATAYAGSGEVAAGKQRIAIDMVVNDRTDSGAFSVNPLTPGPMQSDKGTVAMGGFAFGDTVRNGMKVSEFVRRPTLNGRRGTVQLVQRFDTNEMQNGVRVGVGTWKLAKGTEAYFGVTGGGRYVSFTRPDGRTLVRQEGWVTNSG